MARHRHNRSNRTHHRSSRDIGRERALQHIEDYRRLEAELGGSIEDVKQYLFSLPSDELRTILAAYGRAYGSSAREYAEQRIRDWEIGRVHMAGQTAERLFKLLPPRMPLSDKYQLVEKLWNHVGPRSKKTLRVGLDANLDQVLDAVRRHMDEVVLQYQIPAQLEQRFNWLAAGDAHVKQSLLNHFQQHEKQLVAEAARVQLPVMIEHLRSDAGQNTHRMAQVLIVGNHELELALDKRTSGVAIVEPWTARPAAVAAINEATGYKWLWWVVAVVVILFLIGRK
jgi:DNA-binding NarL/FixJ family response regulator